MTPESEAFLRIKLTADDPLSNEFELVNWQGGVSVWAPGAVITRDADGRELHRLD